MYSNHMDSQAEKMWQQACAMGLEGVLSKRADAPYRSGRSEAWIKVKCVTRNTFSVVGYAPERGGLVAALYLAQRHGRELEFVGKVGTGWSMKQSAELRTRPEALEVDRPAIDVPGKRPTAIWVKPVVKCEVEYRRSPWRGCCDTPFGRVYPKIDDSGEARRARTAPLAGRIINAPRSIGPGNHYRDACSGQRHL